MTTDVQDPQLADDRAARLREVNRRRQRARRWIGFGSIPVVLVVVVLVAKILSMYAFAHSAITAHVSGDAEGTVRAASGQVPLNVFEPYKAPYNAGVGLASGGQLEAARSKFEEALPLAWGLDECAVRVNLSLTLEALGDEASSDRRPADAQELYAEALKVTSEMPRECSTSEGDEASPDPSRSMKDAKDQSERRQQGKQQEQQQDPQQPGPSPSEDPQQEQPSQGKQDELKDLLEQGNEDRDDRDRGDDGGGPETDKPW